MQQPKYYQGLAPPIYMWYEETECRNLSGEAGSHHEDLRKMLAVARLTVVGCDAGLCKLESCQPLEKWGLKSIKLELFFSGLQM